MVMHFLISNLGWVAAVIVALAIGILLGVLCIGQKYRRATNENSRQKETYRENLNKARVRYAAKLNRLREHLAWSRYRLSVQVRLMARERDKVKLLRRFVEASSPSTPAGEKVRTDIMRLTASTEGVCKDLG